MLVHAGASCTARNRFGETPESILQAGDAGKRAAILGSETETLSLAEIEQLESENKEKMTLKHDGVLEQVSLCINQQLNG